MKATGILAKVADIVIIAACLIVLFRPGGLATQVFERWAAERKAMRAVRTQWGELAGVASWIGSPQDSIIVVEFMDYECPFCRSARVALNSLARESRVRIAVHHLPLVKLHPRARGAAIASICAEDAGIFTEYHDLLLSTEAWQASAEPWAAMAQAAGASDTAAFKTCMAGERPLERLRADSLLAQSIGVRSVPSFLTRKRILPGLPSESQLVALVR